MMPVKHTIRQPDGKTKTVTMTRDDAIRFFCYECLGWQKTEVKNCTAPLCPLFPFRPGANFSKKGTTPAFLASKIDDLS
jgi:hypothetical protein